jgi:superfamily II DNA or RNA helicase
MLQVKAKTVGAAAVLPFDSKVAKGLSFVDRFDLPYTMYRVDGADMWVPRGLVASKRFACPMGSIFYDEGVPINPEDNFKPRAPYVVDQTRVVKEACQLLDKGEDFILQAPTGYGKTYLGAKMISHVKKRTLIITTKEDIIDQWKTALVATCGLKLSEIGVWRGILQPAPHQQVVVGLVQSIMKGPERYGKAAYMGFGMVICDEVHRMGAEKFSEAMWWLPAWHRVGLSATPHRKDGRGQVFRAHIGPVLVKAKQDVMKFKVIVQGTGWKVPRVHWYGAYQKMPHSFGRTMNVESKMGGSKQRNAMIVRFCKTAVVKGRHIIVFSSCISHLEALHAALVEGGILDIKIGWYVGLTNYPKGIPKREKLAMRERAKVAPVILATYQMASEATDIPWLDCAVLATPRADVEQIVGRIRRAWEGKKKPVVLDLVDTDSHVFEAYWKSRRKWYEKVGAEIVVK